MDFRPSSPGYEWQTFAVGPEHPYSQGTALFLAAGMGPRLLPQLKEMAERWRYPLDELLLTRAGFLATLLAVNRLNREDYFVLPPGFEADPRSANEGALEGEDTPIVDVHVHVAWREGGFELGKNVTPRGMNWVNMIDGAGKLFVGWKNGIRDLNADTFHEAVFNRSATDMAFIVGYQFDEDFGGKNMNPIEELNAIRARWPDRVKLWGPGGTPNQGVEKTLDRIDALAAQYPLAGLKFFPFDATPERGWFCDDTRLAYPIWERCEKLGIKFVSLDKGMPIGAYLARFRHPEDLDAASLDFPNLNFICFHAAYPYHQELVQLVEAKRPWRQNLLCDLASTFASLVTGRPLECAHVVGMMLRAFGPEKVLWGTDAINWGSPQWQIEAFRRFQIPEQLVNGLGYPQLTPDIRAKVLGGNATRLWNLDVPAPPPRRRT
ncbi:MAG: amidohydrolase family protein [Deltaproteobacteria bacterium]|nr:amidohydrolase family protein [Deltaproteobacteria bacterium]